MSSDLAHVMQEFGRGSPTQVAGPAAQVTKEAIDTHAQMGRDAIARHDADMAAAAEAEGLLPLHALVFQAAPEAAGDLGTPGELRWIDLQDLYIDTSYQRAVLAPGRKNIGRIVKGFNWALFSPLVVAERAAAAGGRRRYAIIDGQHRALGAKTHGGIDALPCLVIHGGPEMEAKAFSIINGQVTAIPATYIHAARVRAKEPDALALDAACKTAGVRILRSCNGTLGMKVGDTMAIVTLEACLSKFGRDVLITALQCVTETHDGNPGFLNQTVIRGLCYVLAANKRALNAGERLFKAIETAGGIKVLHHRAQVRRANASGQVLTHFIDHVRGALADAGLEAK